MHSKGYILLRRRWSDMCHIYCQSPLPDCSRAPISGRAAGPILGLFLAELLHHLGNDLGRVRVVQF